MHCAAACRAAARPAPAPTEGPDRAPDFEPDGEPDPGWPGAVAPCRLGTVDPWCDELQAARTISAAQTAVPNMILMTTSDVVVRGARRGGAAASAGLRQRG